MACVVFRPPAFGFEVRVGASHGKNQAEVARRRHIAGAAFDLLPGFDIGPEPTPQDSAVILMIGDHQRRHRAAAA